MNNKLLLGVGVALIAIGLFKPDLSNWINTGGTVTRPSVVVIEKPSDKDLEIMALKVVDALRSGGSGRKVDGVKLAELYNDLATLISLNGEDAVIKNTEEIRQANSLAGLMLKMDIKGKYSNLAKSCNDLIVSIIGDDSVPLTDTLRTKSVDGFRALSWACNEGSK
jgi:hypothetical protein